MQNRIAGPAEYRKLLQNIPPRREFSATRNFKLEHDPFLHVRRGELPSLNATRRDANARDASVQVSRGGFYRAANNHFHLAFPRR